MTYSLAISGTTNGPFAPKTLTLDDANGGTLGAQEQSMMTNRQVLCKNPDGSQSYYTIDASRYTPGGTPVMQRVR